LTPLDLRIRLGGAVTPELDLAEPAVAVMTSTLLRRTEKRAIHDQFARF
jgi:hypothetical protein